MQRDEADCCLVPGAGGALGKVVLVATVGLVVAAVVLAVVTRLCRVSVGMQCNQCLTILYVCVCLRVCFVCLACMCAYVRLFACLVYCVLAEVCVWARGKVK